MLEIHDMPQGSPEWFAARLAIPTASNFGDVLAKGKGLTRQAYLHKLAGEAITGEMAEGYSNAHMERGKEMEAQARATYEFVSDVECQSVGFIRNGRKGCSPDALIGDAGMLEIKTKLPHLMVATLVRGGMPPEHKAQCQGQLWVSEREWVDFVAFWPGFPLFVHREFRDEAYIANLSVEIDRFNADLDQVVAFVRNYGLRDAA